MKIDNFFAELKRRNVYKVAVAYAIAGWALAQGIAQVFPVFGVPNWVVQLIVLLIVIGFPIALVLAWAFELTPEGLNAPKRPMRCRRTAATEKTRVDLHRRYRRSYSRSAYSFSDATCAREQPRVVESNQPRNQSPCCHSITLSRDPDNAYFAEGVQDEILTRLAKVADLKVISRTSTQHFKSVPENLPQIAKQLGVTNILEGSVRKRRTRCA